MVPDWRLAQIRASASALAQNLSEQYLGTIGGVIHRAAEDASEDDRKEFDAVLSGLNGEVMSRPGMKWTVRG